MPSDLRRCSSVAWWSSQKVRSSLSQPSKPAIMCRWARPSHSCRASASMWKSTPRTALSGPRCDRVRTPSSRFPSTGAEARLRRPWKVRHSVGRSSRSALERRALDGFHEGDVVRRRSAPLLCHQIAHCAVGGDQRRSALTFGNRRRSDQAVGDEAIKRGSRCSFVEALVRRLLIAAAFVHLVVARAVLWRLVLRSHTETMARPRQGNPSI